MKTKRTSERARTSRLAALSAALVALAACSRQAPQSAEAPPPAVAPPTPTSSAATHYTQADFQAKCFPYPTAATMQQYEQVAHLSGQDAIDAEYKNHLSMAPAGECGMRTTASRPAQQSAQSGEWIENAKANDMSHYGDALPGGKH